MLNTTKNIYLVQFFLYIFNSDGVKIILFSRSACTSAHLFLFFTIYFYILACTKNNINTEKMKKKKNAITNINVIDYTRFLRFI